MASVRLYMNKVNGWDKMDTAVTANGSQLDPLAAKLPELRDKGNELRSLYAEHAALAAARQTVTEEMQRVLDEGEQIFRLLREGLRQHYGKRNQKLIEFGVDPLPSRPRTDTTPPPPEDAQ
ncbi:MAG TPA: hypothetical protein VFR31_04760 [Thermoanaerobaculia bacterium]|nr:hypothetical protein [Thermoanaerobaculia bacterium]